MRKLIFLFLLCITCMLQAQNVIDNPKFKFRSGSIYNITRIERTPDATRLHIHVIFRPHWWVKTGKDTHLEDAITGKKYYITGSENFELEKEVYTPDSGTLDFVLIFLHFLRRQKKSICLSLIMTNSIRTIYLWRKKMPKPHFSIKSPATGWEWTTIMNGLLYIRFSCCHGQSFLSVRSNPSER